MKHILHRVTVEKVEVEAPDVRVTGTFPEGGSIHRNSKRTEVSFLTSPFQQPQVGDDLAMFITGPISADQSLNDFLAEQFE